MIGQFREIQTYIQKSLSNFFTLTLKLKMEFPSGLLIRNGLFLTRLRGEEFYNIGLVKGVNSFNLIQLVFYF